MKKAVALDLKEDEEIHFALACAYSLLEETDLGFHHLHCIAKYTKRYKEDILTNDKLAFLRTQPKYEAFYKSYLT